MKNPTSSKWTSVISAPFAICQTAAVVSTEQMLKACPAYLVLLLCLLSNNMSCRHRSHSRIRFFEKCIRSDIQLLCLVFLPPQSELILVHFSGIWQMCTCNSTPLLQTLRAAWLIFRDFVCDLFTVTSIKFLTELCCVRINQNNFQSAHSSISLILFEPSLSICLSTCSDMMNL